MIRRLQAGDPVDLTDLTREHPEYAEPLRRLLPALEALVDLGAVGGPAPPPSEPRRRKSPSLAPRVLGDFRILREIGRGGMGVVYEAEQLSLSRRVALKVLPLAAALDARQFQRFQLEAQAAACLHHTNIVPVFAVGTERGVPFYAMQFIEGRSLAEVIRELRRAEGLEQELPAPRRRSRALGWPTSRRPRWPAASSPARPPTPAKPMPRARAGTVRPSAIALSRDARAGDRPLRLPGDGPKGG